MKTFYKSLSWALVSGVIIGSSAYMESGSLRIAFMTALLASLLKTPFYSLHECLWNMDWRRRTRTVKVEIINEPILEEAL